jgi:hypothetical protein
MPNPLTGDFEAVLQVSGGTVNRLLASMHQNAFAKPTLPSFPHTVLLRIGDEDPVDGVRGLVHAQVGVPRMELRHGSTDRFALGVGVRARYRPDLGTTPLPAFMHGTVHAEYQIQDIGPNCPGWAGVAGDYLWIRVVPESVRFTGTGEDDEGPLEMLTAAGLDTAAEDAAEQAAITKQLAVLLATKFEAAPHPVSKRFRHGSLRSLAAIGGSAVAMPIGLSGEPTGDINSIENLLLEGADFAVGIRQEQLLSMADPALNAIAGYRPTVQVRVGMDWPSADIDTVYRVNISPPTIEWQAHTSFAVIKIKLSGSAETDSILPNATFDVEQDIVVNFDAGSETLWLSPGSRTVKTHSSGLGSGEVANAVNGALHKAVDGVVSAACADAQPSLDALVAHKQELIDQLKSLADQADAWLDTALFLPEGLILRGTIGLAPRKAPVASFAMTAEEDGFSAGESWIPGGRIDKLEWSWEWATLNPPGTSTWADRFILRRPGGTIGTWGMVDVPSPLPGLDGSGSVCLKVKGVRVDSITGELVPVESTRRCTRFGIDISIYPRGGVGRLFVDHIPHVPELSRDVPHPQLGGVREVGGAESGVANTLLLYVNRGWESEALETIRSGLNAVRRTDAGLVLLVLTREGAGDRDRVGAEIGELGRSLGIQTLVSEDVQAAWADAFSLAPGDEEQSWRLLSPGGAVTWMHEGRVGAEGLASALDELLRKSPNPIVTSVRAPLELGAQVIVAGLHPGFIGPARDCPPVPLGRIGVGGAIVTFVQAGHASSSAQLEQLSGRSSERRDTDPHVVAVVDRADADQVQRLRDQLGLDFAVMPDTTGTIADRFGVRIWPTTVTLDGSGTVIDVQLGSANGGER